MCEKGIYDHSTLNKKRLKVGEGHFLEFLFKKKFVFQKNLFYILTKIYNYY
jgi:hypothetical protein